MRYLVLACDYDGTLANEGRVEDATWEALARCRESGRHVVLVTGRDIDDLKRVCPDTGHFEWIVAENGAVLHHPASRREELLGNRPPPEFIEALKRRGVAPCHVGRVVVATWQPHEATVLQTIRDFGVELQVVFNKGAVMVLPTGVNKATGLLAALERMQISPHNAVAVGDAENDHAMLDACEASVAVANAIPPLQEKADLVTSADHGAGVRELIGMLVASDLDFLEPRLQRHCLLLARRPEGEEVRLSPWGTNLLIAGSSGSGKSTAAVAIQERLRENGYQVCIVDPEGDYAEMEGLVAVGTPQQPPQLEALTRLLENPKQSIAVNLLGVGLADRPAFFLRLFSLLQDLRVRLGHPHWVLVDEAHHVLPAVRDASSQAIPSRLEQTALVTLEPSLVAAEALAQVDTVIAAGSTPDRTLQDFCRAVGEAAPVCPEMELDPGELIFWARSRSKPPERIELIPSEVHRRRHRRKYAEGDLGLDRSFYFRGPENKLALRAQNLILFAQIAEGVDDATWLYHLHRSDYSKWFREGIKDENLGREAAEVERSDVSPRESRQRINDLIERHYTLPGSVTLS